ncbi:MAG TPA: citryl-CoA lyase [Gaiellaceae bacterium]|nr:citryl-CoA lyase [Gaiellaceae bacterium]
MTRISRAYPDRVVVRGRDLAGELIGHVSFTAYFHLLVTGHEPSDDELALLDALLVAIAEHGLMPSNVAARMTLAADPQALNGAVAAGILGAGSVILGASEECARLLVAARGRGAEAVVRELHDAGAKVPGFGHPLHRPLDPRAERILELAGERGVAGAYVALAQELRDAVAAVYDRPLTLNVALPIAAVLLDLGYPPGIVNAVPILARTAGLLAHLAEEQEEPIGFLLAAKAEEALERDDD